MFVGNSNVTSSSTEAIYAMLRNLARKYIEKKVCLTDKMEIPITEVIDISNQIDKIVLNGAMQNRRENVSYREASLRTLSLIKQPWNIDEDRKNNKLIPLSYHYLTS